MARGKYQKRKRLHPLPIVFFLLLIAIGAFLLVKILSDDAPETTEPNQTQQTSAPTTAPPETTQAPTTEPTTEPTTVPTEPFVTSTASIGVTGDVLIHSYVYKAAYQGNGIYDFSSMFSYIGDYYENYDFMIANLEVTLAGADRGYSSYPQFNCPDSIVDALQDAGVDMLLNANNHTYDTGHKGFVRTQEVLDEKGMPHLGTRLSEETPLYTVQDINGIKVGMVCYTYETGDTSDGRKTLNGIPVSHDDTELIGSFHPNHLDDFYYEVYETLEAMYADGAEATMVFIHWGDEYQLKQNSKQSEIAQQLCELGVDVIVGGHPHVIQPFDTLVSEEGHTTYCIYSVGNALSNQRRTNISQAPDGHTEDSMIFGVTFEKWNDGSVNVKEVDILPIWVSREWGSSAHEYYIIPLDVENEDWSGFDIPNSNYLYGSYKRTMKIVGEGLNEAREALGLPAAPLTAKDE